MNELSVIIITRNEEERIARCLKSVEWADEIIVVDAYSEDRTQEIARQCGARVILNHFISFSHQKNFALSQAAHDWILSLDADEVVTDELGNEIRVKLADPKEEGYYLRRRNWFLGQELRHQDEEWHLRLFRRYGAWFAGRVHEKVMLLDGVFASSLCSPFLHYSSPTLKDYFGKFKQYTDLEVREMLERGQRASLLDVWVKPFGRFFYTCIIQRGFLDGPKGVLFHLLSAYYYHVKQKKLRRRTK